MKKNNLQNNKLSDNADSLNEEILRSIIYNLPGIISVYNVNPDGTRTSIYNSPGLEELLGPKTAAFIDKNPDQYFTLILPEDADALEAAAQKAYYNQHNLDFTYRVKGDDDKIIYIRSRFNIRDLPGGIIRWEGIIFDVTEQILAQKQLFQSKAHLQSLIEDATDLIWEIDLKGNYLLVNKSFQTILGYDPEKLIGKDSLDLVYQPDQETSIANFHETLHGKLSSYEIRCLSAQNKIFHFWIKLRPIFRQGKITAIHGVGRDITERFKFEQTRDITYRLTEKLNEVNDLNEFSQIIQTELSAIMNTDNFFLAIYHQELDRYSFPYYCDEKDDLDTSRTYSMKNSITDFVRKSAKPIRLTPNNQDIFFQENNLIIHGEDSPCWIGAPIMDKANREAIGVIVIQSYENDSEYSKNDLQTLEFIALNIGTLIVRKLQEIKQININEQLSLITSILRHDLTNDFVVIKSALKLYHKTDDKKFLYEAENKIARGLELINQMRDQEDFAAENRNLIPYRLTEVLQQVTAEYGELDISVTGRASVFADQAIYSIFHNIISNAINHGKADKIEISIETEERKCIVRISNNGVQIPAAAVPKIWQEGFSGKEVNTGMGLYLISKTVENYQGTIFLENNQPQNVSFIIIFQKAIDR
ncbi:MAG: PAS domain S-box protein [Candidatus Cloacimonadales bacterium]